jgi:hypothetical protein
MPKLSQVQRKARMKMPMNVHLNHDNGQLPKWSAYKYDNQYPIAFNSGGQHLLSISELILAFEIRVYSHQEFCRVSDTFHLHILLGKAYYDVAMDT